MGVDFNILEAEGILFSLKKIPKFVYDFIDNEGKKGSELYENFVRQDNYGTQQFDPYGLLCFKRINEIYNQKVGLTPIDFVYTGVYTDKDTYVRGGALIPFVVTVEEGEYLYKSDELEKLIDDKLKEWEIPKDVCDWLKKQEYGEYIISWYS